VHTAQLVKFGVATEYGGSMYDLSKKTVLLTGASKGIGAACARQLGDAGAYVVAHYGGDRSGVEEATASIAKGNKKLIAADFSDLDAVESLWREALAWRGRIDVLVNNAATMRFDGGVDEPIETWDEVWTETLKINVEAPARLLRQAVRHFTTAPLHDRKRRHDHHVVELGGSARRHEPGHNRLRLVESGNPCRHPDNRPCLCQTRHPRLRDCARRSAHALVREVRSLSGR
jgi:NAD(P)-dependent dehydrogenase (short-subunit alcohol dehydrogenase family)